jgi:hypothetical protein
MPAAGVIVSSWPLWVKDAADPFTVMALIL